MKVLSIISAILIVSPIARADVAGIWKGALSLNGVNCEPVAIEITESNGTLSLKALSDQYHTIKCGTPDNVFYFGFENDFEIRGSQLWRYDAQMGELSDDSVLAKDRLCSPQGQCEYWDFLNLTMIDDTHMNFWINNPINGQAQILSGTLSK